MFILIDIDKQFFLKVVEAFEIIGTLKGFFFLYKKNIKQNCDSCFYLAFYLRCNLVKLCCEI